MSENLLEEWAAPGSGLGQWVGRMIIPPRIKCIHKERGRPLSLRTVLILLVASMLFAGASVAAGATSWGPSFTWYFPNQNINPTRVAFRDTTNASNIVSWTWDFGDGTNAVLGPALEHTYTAGVYTSYTVTENVCVLSPPSSLDCRRTSQTVTLVNPGAGNSPTFGPSPVGPALTVGLPNPIADPIRVVFWATFRPFSGPGGGTLASVVYNWSFGDGTWNTTGPQTWNTTGPSVLHVYPAVTGPQTYLVTVTACLFVAQGVTANCQQARGTLQIFDPWPALAPLLLIFGLILVVAWGASRNRRRWWRRSRWWGWRWP